MKKTILLILVVLLAVLIGYFWPASSSEKIAKTSNPSAERDTQSGSVIGSEDANNTYVWLGIPFAAPPVADLRWRSPQPVKPWTETLGTTAFRDACVQLSGPLDGLADDSGAVVGNEDCLYLNIWSPRDHSSATSDKLPV